eukprot:TRINITY_DN45607_c0_g1_i1.p1 TRINITY_DN45607_c0_g1~~TRINITY_DN45607_c0_g1_i1.p1  ORF type:complete len:317 (+),score=75.78 TRINITY_DN45607_c0_g1_i1:37-987(+)
MRTRGASGEFAFRGKKTEDALRDVGDSMKEVFRGVEESFTSIKFTAPGWLSGIGGYAEKHATTPVAAARAPEPVLSQDDAAMRQHCSALERLVEMGLSPQAGKVALRHLDSWLVSDVGRAEMAVAEAEAFASGEPILHVGDAIRLDGLVKNRETNGRLGTLEAYGAESHRWKVRLADDQVFWIKPKLLRPLESKRLPLPDPASPKTTGTDDDAKQSKALAAAWAKFEASQAAWKERHEAREIELLEKEEELRKMQEALDESPVRHVSVEKPPPLAFFVSDETSVQTVPSDYVEEEQETDEMWDMDWSAVASGARPS